MPAYSRILAPVSDELLAHMVAEPAIGAHLFELGDEVGFGPPPLGLLAVRVPDDGWLRGSPWAGRRCGEPPELLADAELRHRFRWFTDVAPPPALVSWLSAAARIAASPIAYYHWREHGDDLYYELAILFDERGPMSLLVRQTFLVDTDDDEACAVLTSAGRTTFVGLVFPRVLEHIRSPSRIGHFPPDGARDFDWETFRVLEKAPAR